MPYKDPQQQQAYQRQWVAARRTAWFEQHGPCVICGSWLNLELDHKDPNSKADHRVWSWRDDKREAELAKCQALCNDCHKLKTKIARGGPKHGTANMYWRYRCRCGPCYTAKQIDNAKRARIKRLKYRSGVAQ